MTHTLIEMLDICDLQDNESISFRISGNDLLIRRLLVLRWKISPHEDLYSQCWLNANCTASNYEQNPNSINDAIATSIRDMATEHKEFHNFLREKKE